MKIGVTGCGGRMGQTLVAEILRHPDCKLAGGTEAPGSPSIGLPLNGGDLLIGSDPAALFETCDAVLDFTRPAASIRHAQLAARSGKILVLGTTGFEGTEQAEIDAAARAGAVIVQSGNFSLGVNLLAQLIRRASALLDNAWDIEIVEMHHRMKVDAPSGTALLLGRAAAEGRGVALDDVAARGRDGITGARKAGEIGFASLRGGTVVGDHTVVLATDHERIELTHRAEDRAIFARGAVHAALWAEGKPAGLYTMADVLAL